MKYLLRVGAHFGLQRCKILRLDLVIESLLCFPQIVVEINYAKFTGGSVSKNVGLPKGSNSYGNGVSVVTRF